MHYLLTKKVVERSVERTVYWNRNADKNGIFTSSHQSAAVFSSREEAERVAVKAGLHSWTVWAFGAFGVRRVADRVGVPEGGNLYVNRAA